jgi:long-chain acyl-CoA synthetase
MLARGGAIGYGTTKTITDTSVGLKVGSCKGDAPELRPTLMAAVPAIMDKIRNGVTKKVNEAGGIKAKLFNKAFASKANAIKQGNDSPFWNKLVFDKLRARLLGGRLRFMLSGGGPMSKATQEFMNVVFCCPVGQGYGLTETCGSGTIVWPNDRTVGRVGAPIPCAQIKLRDWEEGGYFVDPSKNEDKSVVNPRGEVMFGGPLVSMGYYKMPDKTAEDYFTDDNGVRWFCTGDVGEMAPDGVLTLIDRKKDLVKLSGGEYVSYGKLEPLIRDSAHVDNAMVYADPLQPYCVAVVCRSPDSKATEEEILKDIQKILKTAKVAKFEIPKKIKVVDEQWNPENDLATAALKLKRQNLQKHYKDVLAALYA